MTQVIVKAFATAAIVAAVVVSGRVLLADESAPGRQMPVTPVFTEQQAAAGKAVFGTSCAGCHMVDLSGHDDAPPLAGVPFASSWGTRSTKDLLDYVSTAMPPGGPSLTPDEYVSIVAHILQVNGAGAGAQALTASTIASIGGLLPPRPTQPNAGH